MCTLVHFAIPRHGRIVAGEKRKSAFENGIGIRGSSSQKLPRKKKSPPVFGPPAKWGAGCKAGELP